MASDRKREQLLVKVEGICKDIICLNTVQRKPIMSIAELEEFSAPQLPVLVVFGGLPVPGEKMSSRRPNMDQSLSTLSVSLIAYIMDNVEPDSTISYVADELWVALLDDATPEAETKPAPAAKTNRHTGSRADYIRQHAMTEFKPRRVTR